MKNSMIDRNYLLSLVEILGHSLYSMAKGLEPGSPKHSEMLDYLNHMSGILQQMEYELDGDNVQ